MRVTILGCGGSAGVPQIGGPDGRGDWGACDPAEPRNRRTRSSIVVEGPEGRLLVDTGPDLRDQLLACAVPSIEAIFYTHAHADHITGLDEARILNRIAGRPLDAHATAEVLDDLARRFDYAFKPWTPPNFFRPVLVPRPVVPGTEIALVGLSVRVLDQDHAFSRTLGLRIGPFAYSTDVVRLDDDTLAALRGVDTWVVDCFQRGRHASHANLPQIVAWNETVGARRVILTHMGPDLDWHWLRAHCPAGFEPAHDGMRLSFSH